MNRYDYRLSERFVDNRVDYFRQEIRHKKDLADNEKSGWKVIGYWFQRPQSFGRRVIREGYILLSLPRDSDDGWIQYLHKLDRKKEGASEWELVGFLEQNDESEIYLEEADIHSQKD